MDPSSSFEDVLSHVLQKGKGQQRSRDPRSVRLAAVTSALVESAAELRGDNECGRSTSTAAAASAAEVFTAGLAALSATVASEDASAQSSPQLPLLELLALTIPHVPAGLYLNQFALLSRSLRGVAASALADGGGGKSETRDELGGLNATVRASARCATSALSRVAAIDAEGTGTAPVGEKELLKLYGGTVLNLFDDRRAKVRRAAHGATVELSMLRGGGGGAGKGKGKLAGAIPSHVVEYSHAVLSSFLNQNETGGANKGETSDRAVRVMHLLHLLSNLFPALTDAQRVRLGEDIIKLALNLLGGGTGHGAEDAKRLGGPQGILLANASLSALLVVLESEPSTDGHDAAGNAVDQFAARVLASLLSNNGGQPDIGTGDDGGGDGSDEGGECLVLYGRAVVASSSRLSRSGEEQRKVAAKLLPLSISCVLSLADRHNSLEVARSVSSELTRLIRTGMPSPLSRLADAEGTKCARGCITAMEKVLHHRFRSTWSVTLSPLATTIELSANSIIGSDGNRKSIDGNEGSEGTAEMKMIKGLVGEPLNALVRLHEDVNDGPSRSAVEGAVGAIVGGIGVEMFWDLVSLTEFRAGGAGGTKKKKRKQSIEGGISTNRAWLLPILKSSSLSSSSPRRLRLAFFQRNILGLARSCDAASAGGNLTAVESSIQKSRVVDLWSLFPSFCINPSDIELTFPTLAQILVRAMGDVRYPQLVSIVCIGLKMLASGVSQRATESSEFIESNDPETDQLQADARVLSEVSVKLLPALFKTAEILHNTAGTKKEAEDDMNIEDGTDDPSTEKKALATQDAQRAHAVTEAIGEFARLAPQPFLMNLFKKIMQRLLAATQAEDDETEKICTLLGLAQALVTSGSLDEGGVSLLYRAVKPLIRSDEYDSRVQKRAYKVMVEICERHTAFVTAPERLDEMTELMVGSLMTCQVSARHMRLKCMLHMVKGFDSSHSQQMDVIPKIMGEVLLCLKDSNAKTREAAYQLLLAMAVSRNDMTDFFQIVLAALGAQTPHMRSAAVMALSRLVFEYSREDESVQALLPSLLQTVIVLFDENSREVIKSVVAFVRVSVAALGSEQLEPLLPEVVGGLMKYNKGKGRFRAKIKIILKKLVRTYGYEKITPLVPEGDARLLTHMRKLAEREARRKAENQESGRADGRGNDFDEMMDSDEDDSDGGRTLMTGATGFTRMTARSGKSTRSAAVERSEKARSVRSVAQSAASNRTTGRGGAGAAAPRIRAEKNGDVIDMLDPSMAKSVHFADERDDNEFSDDDNDADGVMEFDDSGKLVIHDNMDGGAHETSERGDVDDGADGENEEIRGGGKRRRISKFENAKVERAEASALENKKKRKKSNEPKALGAAFKSKRAGGDLKKKGQKYEPYAYVPLDGKSYTKKNRSKAVAQMSTIVRDKGGKRKRR